MTGAQRDILVVCNGAQVPRAATTTRPLLLEYRAAAKRTRNVTLKLPAFVDQVLHLPHRVLDLLELAAYIFAADRLSNRGPRDAVEYHGWSRRFRLITKVRDPQFWKHTRVQSQLARALRYMTGDRDYSFSFRGGHATPPSSLFDKRGMGPRVPRDPAVILFSGGLDSFAGVIQQLETTAQDVCLVTHQSSPGSIKTQNRLVEALLDRYPNRVAHYCFHCTLHGVRAAEETQRTRSFLYLSTAFAVAQALRVDRCYVYENGVTALNLPKRQELMLARASRTVHPETIALLQNLLATVAGSPFIIETPFVMKTKAEVFEILRTHKQRDLLSSTVSCSRTFRNLEAATHCGGCSQCIDRKFAAYAAGLGDIDSGSGIYAFDFNRERITDPEVRTALIDYVRQASRFARWNIDHFYQELLSDVAPICEALEPRYSADDVWALCRRHGQAVERAIRAMRDECDDPFVKLVPGSFQDLVAARTYLQEPVQRLISSLIAKLCKAVPIAFQRRRPDGEAQLNDQIHALIEADYPDYVREHPAVRFGIARTIPDHSLENHDLLLEGKYVRDATTPSKATEGIAADLTKYPERSHILFVVYDPDRSIADDTEFAAPFERKGRCTICVVR